MAGDFFAGRPEGGQQPELLKVIISTGHQFDQLLKIKLTSGKDDSATLGALAAFLPLTKLKKVP